MSAKDKQSISEYPFEETVIGFDKGEVSRDELMAEYKERLDACVAEALNPKRHEGCIHDPETVCLCYALGQLDGQDLALAENERLDAVNTQLGSQIIDLMQERDELKVALAGPLARIAEVEAENRRLRLVVGEVMNSPAEDWEAVKRDLGIPDTPPGEETLALLEAALGAGDGFVVKGWQLKDGELTIQRIDGNLRYLWEYPDRIGDITREEAAALLAGKEKDMTQDKKQSISGYSFEETIIGFDKGEVTLDEVMAEYKERVAARVAEAEEPLLDRALVAEMVEEGE